MTHKKGLGKVPASCLIPDHDDLPLEGKWICNGDTRLAEYLLALVLHHAVCQGRVNVWQFSSAPAEL